MKDLIKKTKAELETILYEKRESLRKFRFGVSGSKVKNTKEGFNLRKEIAQILTIINSREIK
ncbi:MAG: 50S ribosomal protein L29 [Minisyncoccia bacterium]